MSEALYPPRRRAWALVALLMLAYLLSYVDRTILGLLIQPIKADLKFSDEKIGWLLGPAFAVFYATIGVPCGWLADRRARTRIIAAGMALWSAATVFSGMARSFGQLFAARMSVGVGEAVLSPAAVSLIADNFPPERRARPIAIYSMAITLGSGLASLIGAAVLGWAKGSAGIVVPGLGLMAPWQLTFLAVGVPGLAVSLVFLLVREPRRIAVQGGAGPNGFGTALAHIGAHKGDYARIAGIAAAMVTVAYSQGFLPAAFERRWGWPPEYFARWNGISALVIGPAMYLWAGSYCDRQGLCGDSGAPLRVMTWAIAVLAPSCSLALLMPGPWPAFAMLCVGAACIGAISAVAVTALLQITPAEVRGQVVALYYMSISITGLLLGPTTVGFLSTRVFGEDRLYLAVAAVPALFASVPAVYMIARELRRRR